MDRNFFIAMALCAGIYLVWQNHYTKTTVPVTHTQVSAGISSPESTVKPTEISLEKTSKVTSVSQSAQTKEIVLGNEKYGVHINTKGGVITAVDLDEYKGKKVSNLKELLGGSAQLDLATSNPEYNYITDVVYNASVEKNEHGENTTAVLTYDDANIKIERKFTLRADIYSTDHEAIITFKKGAVSGYLFTGLKTLVHPPKFDNESRKVYFSKLTGGMSHWATTDFSELKEELTEGHWAGVTSRYFMSAIIERESFIHPQFKAYAPNTEDYIQLAYKLSTSPVQLKQRYYFGPKDADILKSVGQTADLAVDFGWFTFIAYPMLLVLKSAYKVVHNYGIAIIILTLLAKALTYPLTMKSMKSMKHMQKIQPQIQKLREKHKDDKEKLNREMMQMMKTSGYNPMSGCLPMFIQMPIFIALYNVLYGAIDLYNQPFFGWIHDLSLKDPFFITPILLTAVMWLQQKLTPQSPGMDPNQQKMMMFMPVIFGVMMMSLPAGLTLYMLVNSIASIIQQMIINKQLGLHSNAQTAA